MTELWTFQVWKNIILLEKWSQTRKKCSQICGWVDVKLDPKAKSDLTAK